MQREVLLAGGDSGVPDELTAVGFVVVFLRAGMERHWAASLGQDGPNRMELSDRVCHGPGGPAPRVAGLWFGVRFFLSFWTVPSESGETRDVPRETLSGAVLNRGPAPRV